jgi:hypothetical protein
MDYSDLRKPRSFTDNLREIQRLAEERAQGMTERMQRELRDHWLVTSDDVRFLRACGIQP